MKRLLELKQDGSGQWLYRVIDGERIVVSWQFGPFDRNECIKQAKDRFGSDLSLKGREE